MKDKKEKVTHLLNGGRNVRDLLLDGVSDLPKKENMFRKAKLKSGIPVLMERIPGIHSVALTILAKVGSRNEDHSNNGISHFIEHLHFDGTKNRTQKEMSIEQDSIGAFVNAYTDREQTCYHIVMLDEFMEQGIDLLSDLFCNPLFDDQSVEKEKGVIAEEIKMFQDDPDRGVYELYYKNSLGKEGLGMPVIGTHENVSSFTRDTIMNFYKEKYTNENITIACCGNFDYDDLLFKLEKKFTFDNPVLKESSQRMNTPSFIGDYYIEERDTSHVYLVVGLKGLRFGDNKESRAFELLNSIVGGGVSSRLWQNLREDKGLVYSTYSYIHSFSDTGLFAVYAATGKDNYKRVIAEIMNELVAIKNNITEEDLTRAKKQFRGHYKQSLDMPLHRALSIMDQEIHFKSYKYPEQVMKIMESIGITEVKDIAEKVLSSSMYSATILGPVKHP